MHALNVKVAALPCDWRRDVNHAQNEKHRQGGSADSTNRPDLPRYPPATLRIGAWKKRTTQRHHSMIAQILYMHTNHQEDMNREESRTANEIAG